jgi:hypothetical protein
MRDSGSGRSQTATRSRYLVGTDVLGAHRDTIAVGADYELSVSPWRGLTVRVGGISTATAVGLGLLTAALIADKL